MKTNWMKPKQGLLSLGTYIQYTPEGNRGLVKKTGFIVGYPTCVNESGDDGTYVLELLDGEFRAAWDSEVKELENVRK